MTIFNKDHKGNSRSRQPWHRRIISYLEESADDSFIGWVVMAAILMVLMALYIVFTPAVAPLPAFSSADEARFRLAHHLNNSVAASPDELHFLRTSVSSEVHQPGARIPVIADRIREHRNSLGLRSHTSGGRPTTVRTVHAPPHPRERRNHTSTHHQDRHNHTSSNHATSPVHHHSISHGDPNHAMDGLIRVVKGDVESFQALIPPTRQESEAHGSNLLELPNGDILLAFFDGFEGEGMVAIVVARLVAGSNQWEDAVVVSEELGRSNQNPVLFFSEATQTLLLLHTSQMAKKGQGTSEVRELRSTDMGRTWSAPVVKIDDKGIFIRNRILLSEKEEWLLPAYYTPHGMGDHKSQYSAMLRSSNAGQDWATVNRMSKPDKHGAVKVQPSVIRVPAAPREAEEHGAADMDGSDDEEVPWSKLAPGASTAGAARVLKAFFRDREAEWVYMSKSFDDGLHWTQPQRTVLPNNDKAIQATVLRNGHVLIVFGNGQGSKAKWGPIAVALSTNNGETWTYVRDLEEHYDKALEYSYPSIMQDRDGRIHISYTWSLKRRRVAIRHRIISEEWIKVGGTQGMFEGCQDAHCLTG